MGSIKYYKTVLVVLAIVVSVLVYGLFDKQNLDIDQEEASPVGWVTIPFDLSQIEEKINYAISENGQGKILPIMILKTSSCPPCINNVIDYFHLISEDETFLDMVLLFTNDSEKNVERFLTTREIDIPFVILDAMEIDESLSNLPQNLIFVDHNREQAFFNLEIPNSITSISYKSSRLSDIIKVWREGHNLYRF